MISVTILTFNSEKTLEKTLQSVKDFEEVFILDSGSKDRTEEIARSFPNVRFEVSTPFPGFGPQRRIAEQKARFDWIFALDSDEILTTELKDELNKLIFKDSIVYALPRRNFFYGKQIKHSGWAPDYCLRIYNRKKTGFDKALVHENVMMQGMQEVKLKAPLEHTPYDGAYNLLQKMQSYSEYFANQEAGKKHSSLRKALFRGFWAFFRTFILRKGILDGREGLIISLYNAHSTYYKYLKITERS